MIKEEKLIKEQIRDLLGYQYEYCKWCQMLDSGFLPGMDARYRTYKEGVATCFCWMWNVQHPNMRIRYLVIQRFDVTIAWEE